MQYEEDGGQTDNNDASERSDVDEVILDVTPEEETLTDLEKEKMRSEELQDQLTRLQAEFDNYRKRMDSRFLEASKFAAEGILLKIIEVYDNLERAAAADFTQDPSSAKAGVIAIRQQFEKLLKIEGVRLIESVGKEFDPYYQHSVSTVNVPDQPDGIITEVYQNGYMLREKVLRPALVCVNRHVDDKKEDDEDSNESLNEGD
jgi:molecular chaperone GrpE